MIILEAELGRLIPEFSDRAKERLERDGQKLVDSLTPMCEGPFDLSVIAERVDELRASILEEFCEAVPNAEAGPPDPAKRAERRLRLKRLEEAEALAERAGGSFVEHRITEFAEVPLGESVTPKDEWELLALRLNKPELLLPGPKLEARKQINDAMEGSVEYLLRQAGKRSKINRPAAESPSPGVPEGVTTGAKIKALREECGWSQNTLAIKTSFEQSTIARHELDGMRPRVETLKVYANVFSKQLGRVVAVADLKP